MIYYWLSVGYPKYCLKNRGCKMEDRNDFLGFFFEFGGKFSVTHRI